MRKVDPEETKREKARKLRYKKAIAKEFNLQGIKDALCGIQEECDAVRYYIEDDDDDTLLNALCGDEDQEFEFKMMFADLCAECEQMWMDLEEDCVPECFDTFFGAVTSDQLLGYDDYVGDYFGLYDRYEDMMAKDEGKKRMLRMTKKEIIESAYMCFRVAQAYIGLVRRYDCMKAALDILRDENTGFLQMAKRIEEAYENADAKSCGFQYQWDRSVKELDLILESMPQEAWLQ